MEFVWDVPAELHDGMPLVYKRCALLSALIKSKRQAREAAAIDATIVNDLHASRGNFVAVLDLKDVRFRPCIYTFIKESVRLQAARPYHTYIVNMPGWGAKVFQLARKWLNEDDVATCTTQKGPWTGVTTIECIGP